MAFQKYYGLEPTARSTRRRRRCMTVRSPSGPRPRADAGTLVEIDKAKQLLFFVIDGSTEWILNTSTGNGEPYEEQDKNTPGEVHHRRLGHPQRAARGVPRARPKAGGKATSARSTGRSTSRAAWPCTARTASPTTRRRTAACASSVPAMDWIWE